MTITLFRTVGNLKMLVMLTIQRKFEIFHDAFTGWFHAQPEPATLPERKIGNRLDGNPV